MAVAGEAHVACGVADDGQDIDLEIPFLKEYTVFNAEQREGLPPHFSMLSKPPRETLARIEQAE